MEIDIVIDKIDKIGFKPHLGTRNKNIKNVTHQIRINETKLNYFQKFLLRIPFRISVIK